MRVCLLYNPHRNDIDFFDALDNHRFKLAFDMSRYSSNRCFAYHTIVSLHEVAESLCELKNIVFR